MTKRKKGKNVTFFISLLNQDFTLKRYTTNRKRGNCEGFGYYEGLFKHICREVSITENLGVVCLAHASQNRKEGILGAVYIFGNSPLAAPYPELGMALTAASKSAYGIERKSSLCEVFSFLSSRA